MKYLIATVAMCLGLMAPPAASLTIGNHTATNGQDFTYTGRSLIVDGVEYIELRKATDEEKTLRIDPYPETSFDLTEFKTGTNRSPINPATGEFYWSGDDPLYKPVPVARKHYFVGD